MPRLVTAQEAAALIPPNATVMVGGYLGCGSPQKLLDALVELGTGGLTVINNDGGMPDGPDGLLGSGPYGIAKLIANGQVRKLIASHIGVNPQVERLMKAGSLEVSLVPQGSLAEMIRAGGAGLGGVLTRTGLGTQVEQMEHVVGRITVDGEDYLLERPLKADFALLNAYQADPCGNLWYRGTTRNFNQVMALAAETVLVEADHLLAAGQIAPENVMTPGLLVKYLVDGGAE